MSNILAERQNIVEQAEKIASMVANSLEMSIFKQAERDLSEDDTVQSLLAEVHAKQEAGEDVEDLLDRLESLDVVRHFTIAQDNLSQVVTQITKILGAYASDRVDSLDEKEGTGGCSSCPGADLCSGGQSGKSENCDGGHDHGHDHACDSGSTSCAG